MNDSSLQGAYDSSDLDETRIANGIYIYIYIYTMIPKNHVIIDLYTRLFFFVRSIIAVLMVINTSETSESYTRTVIKLF